MAEVDEAEDLDDDAEVSGSCVHVEEGPEGDSTAVAEVDYRVDGLGSVSDKLGGALAELESALGLPLWLLINDGPLDQHARSTFFQQRREIAGTESAALLIDSPGGDAKAAFQIGRIFQKGCHSSGFLAVVPRYAKSAATLLAFGASEIVMAEHAELGPLDAQIMDPDRESLGSALDEVQALEHLHREVLRAIDEMMQLLLGRTGKKVESILPMVLEYHARFMAPLLDKIDTVHYTQQARVLEVGADYARRLLIPTVGPGMADQISRHFVHHYAEHGFVVDDEECQSAGVQLYSADNREQNALERVADLLDISRDLAIGRFAIGSSGVS